MFGAFAGGALGGLLGSMLGSLESVQALLKIIGSALNAFIAPFIPILLTLFKPFLALFLLVGALLIKFLKNTFGGSGLTKTDKEGQTKLGGTGALVTAGVGAILGSIAVGLTIGFGAVPALVTAAILGALALLTPMLVNVGAKFSKWLSDALSNFITLIDNVFGTSFGQAIQEYIFGIIDVFKGLFNILTGLLTLDFTKAWEGVRTVISGFGRILKGIGDFWYSVLKLGFLVLWKGLREIFIGAWEGLVRVFNWITTTISSIAVKFANAFIAGLNAIIGILNKVPGVDIDRIRNRSVDTSSTNITINVQGNADQKVTDDLIRQLQQKLRLSGGF